MQRRLERMARRGPGLHDHVRGRIKNGSLPYQCPVSEVGDIDPVIQAASGKAEDDGCIGHTAEDDNEAGRRLGAGECS